MTRRTEADRPSYHEMWMGVAQVVAKRSTCARRAVGCVVVDEDNRVLSTGYNGVPSRHPHCTEHACPGALWPSGQGLEHCQAVHAEQNAVARLSDVRHAAVLYCTTSPCITCVKLIAATPVRLIVAAEGYALSGEAYWVDVIGREWVNLK